MNPRTEISALGRTRFIEQLTSPFSSTVVTGIGDDMAVIDRGVELELIGTTLFMEGIDFDLSYTPLEHLGFKLTTAAVSNAAAMNGYARYITVAVGLSARFAVQEAQALYRGIEHGCRHYGLELLGGDTAASMTGLTLSVSCIGYAERDRLTLRSGASADEILCSTGTLGAAYMGLKLLEREKCAAAAGETTKEIFNTHKTILSHQLQPIARQDIIELLAQNDILPSAMIDITSGLASATLTLCKASGVGARIYLNKLPINGAVSAMADELNADPIVAILNGGDDYELLFTVDATQNDKVRAIEDIHVIGFTTTAHLGAAIVTPDGEAIEIQSPDFKNS